MVQIKPVLTAQDWNAFLTLPSKVYAVNPYWVPPVRMAVREALDIEKNPFFKRATRLPLLAFKGNQVVGRIVAIIDDHYNQVHQEQVVFFGYFECLKDSEAAKALFSEAQLWGKQRGMKVLRGPVDLYPQNGCGLLVDGFELRPAVGTGFNPQYYVKMLGDFGLNKAKDLLAYSLQKGTAFSESLDLQGERLKQQTNVRIRPIQLRRFDQELEKILEIYNGVWGQGWGMAPLHLTELRYQMRRLKWILDPELFLLAEVGHEVVGLAWALPDINQVLQKIPHGKLWPMGWLSLLWNLKGPGRKRGIHRCRVLALGIKKRYRDLELEPLFYLELAKRVEKLGYQTGEASLVLEDNRPLQEALLTMEAKQSKVYRVFEKNIG